MPPTYLVQFGTEGSMAPSSTIATLHSTAANQCDRVSEPASPTPFGLVTDRRFISSYGNSVDILPFWLRPFHAGLERHHPGHQAMTDGIFTVIDAVVASQQVTAITSGGPSDFDLSARTLMPSIRRGCNTLNHDAKSSGSWAADDNKWLAVYLRIIDVAAGAALWESVEWYLTTRAVQR